MRQSSVLSPSLFLLLIVSLLHRLAESNAGITLENIYMGSLAPADDLRCLTCDPSSSEKQVKIIEDFLSKNFLQLHISKCELIVHSDRSSNDNISVQIGSTM